MIRVGARAAVAGSRPPRSLRSSWSPLNRFGRETVLAVVSSDDPAAFCDQVRTRLVGALTLACGDRDVAEELAQDTLVKVWERWAQVKAMDSREAWVFRTAFNLAHSWGRRTGAERRANRRAGTNERWTSDDDLAEVVAVRRAVACLPDRQRAVIVTRFYLGYDVAATAALLGCAPGTVKAATHQALENLRRSGLVNDLPEEVRAT